MSKLKTGLNSLFACLLFVFGFAKGVVARVFPSAEPGLKPVGTRVFALSEAAWAELRASDRASSPQQQSPRDADQKGPDQKKDDSKGSSNDSPKNTDKKNQSKAECEKADEKASQDSKAAPAADCKDKGAGGGDGDLGGTGG